MAQRLMWIMWPGFFMAIPAVGVVFSLFDPEDMHLMGAPVELGSLGAYSIGFLGIWLFGACCSALTCLLQRTPPEVNHPSDK